MTPTDFGLSVIASWLANKLGKEQNQEQFDEPEISVLNETEKPEILALNETVESVIPTVNIKLFEVYDVFRDLEKMLSYIENPCAHIIVETSPTTFYHLASLVIEDRNTGIWFVFNRGRMSFQGAGGGAQQTDRAVSILKDSKIPVAPWAVSKGILDRLEKGYVRWPEVKNQLVPLVSSFLDESKWPWIQMRAKGVIYNETEDA